VDVTRSFDRWVIQKPRVEPDLDLSRGAPRSVEDVPIKIPVGCYSKGVRKTFGCFHYPVVKVFSIADHRGPLPVIRIRKARAAAPAARSVPLIVGL